MGVELPAPPPGKGPRKRRSCKFVRELADKGFVVRQARQAGQLGAHGFAVADDLSVWPAARWK